MKIFITAAGGLVVKEWIALFEKLNCEFVCADVKLSAISKKYCKENYIIPYGDTPEFISFLKNKALSDKNIDYFILNVDEEIINLSENIYKMSGLDLNKFLVPVGEKIIQMCDKYKLKTLIKSADINYPKTYIMSDFGIKNGKIFPFVLKKRIGRGARNLFCGEDKRDFDYFASKIANYEEYIVQEKIEGDIAYFDIVVDKDNYFWVGLKKTMIYYNNGVYDFKIIWDKKYSGFIESIINTVKKVSQNIRYIINVDVIINKDKVYLMEINPRPGIAFATMIQRIPELKRIFNNFINKKSIECGADFSKYDGIEFLCQIYREINV